MRDIVADTFLIDAFFMAGSADLWTGITSLAFANSGDVQLSKNGGAFADISGNVGVTERGFGWYSLGSSDTDHMNTVGKNVLHISETDSVSSIPAELVLNVVLNNVHSLSAQNSGIAVQVSSHDVFVNSFDASVTSNFNAVITQITALDSVAGKIVVPFGTVIPSDPVDIRRATFYDATFYPGQVFSSFAAQPVYFTGKDRDTDGTPLFTVQGTVSNTTSMSLVFSLHPTSHTNQELTEHGLYEIQFRAADGSVIKDAMAGTMRIQRTLKLT